MLCAWKIPEYFRDFPRDFFCFQVNVQKVRLLVLVVSVAQRQDGPLLTALYLESHILECPGKLILVMLGPFVYVSKQVSNQIK